MLDNEDLVQIRDETLKCTPKSRAHTCGVQIKFPSLEGQSSTLASGVIYTAQILHVSLGRKCDIKTVPGNLQVVLR